MLDQFNPVTDEAIRQLYVAITRAKRKLIIHYNGSYFNFIKTENLSVVDNFEVYQPPCHLAMQLTFRDVWLDFFLPRQNLISQLNSGDILIVEGDGCCNLKGQPVLKFSKQLINQIKAMKQQNYEPKTAKIRFIVYWQKENSEHESKIFLPELYFERSDSC